MISGNNYKSVTIDITTYKKRFFGYYPKTMNEDGTDSRYCKGHQNRFICSICLNRKTSHERNNEVECCKRKFRSCPKCQKQDDEGITVNKNVCKNKQNITSNEKNVETSEHEVTQGLTLLNEVLTVFQSKKQIDIKKEKYKTVIFKDACVGTENNVKNIHHLSTSKLFRYSIESSQVNENGKFTIISCQPDTGRSSQFSLDLTKHKSSSIPQMKLDELKNSFKEKTKSKDAIEEVNRMFATVRKNDAQESCDLNRPMIRNGPRVLPVVKTPTYDAYKASMKCKCCQTNYQMSSGDSVNKHECCQKTLDKGDEFLYVCFHCQKNNYSNNCIVCEHCCHKDYKIQNVEP